MGAEEEEAASSMWGGDKRKETLTSPTTSVPSFTHLTRKSGQGSLSSEKVKRTWSTPSWTVWGI